ncbi:signal transduction histidine kinase [Microbacteriaceae bacterium SG_E_30_P1]|uniref:Signal transduction histidine kinase n=1 Tax=Antiquaquibacter oligotrophicus TaxID=2880260 RepID=A0ABT6KS03_9MICO|nr:sensor histidine kinase [Antiquaquibacter oligotrophicus]MDH6181974.1 signal transduction histidine kinase [Antiquaquibacter oligotrophicus]UDF12357.1 sensor histidine kinase [Antiquaquibacter oligotrophicus]
MENPRWWDLAVSIMSGALTIMVIASDERVDGKIGAIVAIGIFAAAWFVIGRRAFRSATAAYTLTGIIVLSLGLAVAHYPIAAILQCVGYPLIWIVARRTREAIIANVALSVSVLLGFLASTGDLAQALITSGLSLAFSLAFGLWISRIATLSDERKHLIDELTATQDRLAVVSRDAGVASERERLAREIHDTIAQDLTGLVLLTQQARRELADNPAAADARLQLIEDSARTALAETRALVAASAAVGLADGELLEALGRLGERFTRETGVAVSVTGDPGPLGREDEVVLLRCAQEGLANVRKHSGATAATIELSGSASDVGLVVRDNGHGFNPAADSTGFGLPGMRERLSLVGGSLDIASSRSGTVLTARIPRNAP